MFVDSESLGFFGGKSMLVATKFDRIIHKNKYGKLTNHIMERIIDVNCIFFPS